MRITRFVLATALMLVAVPAAAQQTTPATPTIAPPVDPAAAESTSDYVPATKNVLDFGARGSSVTGDSARYERYRDLSDGAFIRNVRLTRDKNGWLFAASGQNVGRLDQRFSGEAGKPGKFRLFGIWDQIPMLMSRTTKTLFIE